MRWDVPVELTAAERRVADRLRRTGKFYVFLRQVRHELFDEDFEAQLARAYGKARGTEPLPPSLLAMVTLLQAYDRVGDANAVETAEMDRRWQLVLGCLGCEGAPFSQGSLVNFRNRMVEHDLDKKLLERTVELAKKTGLFGWQHLKAALDSSPLLGAGRVEDTYNLIGRALSTVVECAAKALGIPRRQILDEAQVTVLDGTSIKAALDIDWDDPAEKARALTILVEQVASLEAWVAARAGEATHEPPLREALALLRRVVEQDLEPDPGTGAKRIKKGVAKDRMPSLGDPEMRHGRKSKKRPFNGYKRHIVKAVGTGFIVEALVRPANQPEYEAMPELWAAMERHGAVEQAAIDRGYLSSPKVTELRAAGVEIACKPWPSRNAGRFTKEDFELRLDDRRVICPAGAQAPIRDGSPVVHFPPSVCRACALRSACTEADGRTISIHPQEALLVELRQRRRTKEGRLALRERVTVEHSLARLGQIQGPRARYKSARKNTLDARRCSAVANLQEIARLRRAA